MTLTPIQKLDIVLEALQKQDSFKTRDEIATILTELGTPLNEDDLVRILDKLVNDGYIIETKQDRHGVNIPPRYLISYSGHLFDSYSSKSIRDLADAEKQRLDINRLKELSDNADRNQVRLNNLTRWLTVGTIVLAAMEIIKFLCEMDAHLKSFFERHL